MILCSSISIEDQSMSNICYIVIVTKERLCVRLLGNYREFLDLLGENLVGLRVVWAQ